MILIPKAGNNKNKNTDDNDFFLMLNKVENVQKRSDIEIYKKDYLKCNIIIPDFFYKSTLELSNQSNEHRGIMLASKENIDNKIFFTVKYMKILGSGTSTSVNLDQNKFETISKLILNHPELKVIEFHVHTKDTGSYREDKFSSKNYQNIEKALKNNIEYIHVLFTPSHILTLAKQKTNISLAKTNLKTSENLIQFFQKMDEEFNNTPIK